MKVYEKLGLPYLTEAQYGIIDGLYPPKCGNKGMECDENCVKCTYEYFMSDVPTKKVKRWETYNGDFDRAWSDYATNVKDFVVSQRLFANWLMEEMEVEG